MSHSKPEKIIIFFRSAGSILQTFDGTRNAIDINEIKRFSPEVFARYSFSMLNEYKDTFFKNLDLSIDCKYTLSKSPEIDSTLEALLFAGSNNNDLSELVIYELRSIVDYGLLLTQDCSDLFDTPGNIAQLSKAKKDFVEEYARGFLEKHGGKNISKPFEWKVGGSDSSFTPFQGRIKPGSINNEIDDSDFILQAKLDGFKNSEMLIYLQEIDSELKLNKTSIAYKAAKPSLLKTAADIYVNSSPAYVTITAFKKSDEKGKVGLYMRDIASYEYDEITEGTSENLSLLLSFSENDSKTQKNS